MFCPKDILAKEWYHNGEKLTIRMRRESEGIHHD